MSITAASSSSTSVAQDTLNTTNKLKLEKTTTEAQITKLQATKSKDNKTTIKTLQKQSDQIEKQTEQLQNASSSTGQTNNTNKAASTPSLNEKSGPAYQTSLSDAGLSALNTAQDQKNASDQANANATLSNLVNGLQ
jgi:hypothetical protein